MTRYCSLPEFGNIRKWFEKNFNKPCEYHDRLYDLALLSRLRCDIELVKYMHRSVQSKKAGSRFFTRLSPRHTFLLNCNNLHCISDTYYNSNEIYERWKKSKKLSNLQIRSPLGVIELGGLKLSQVEE